MGYTELAYWHLATIAPAFLMSSYILLARKGTPRHKSLGKIYMLVAGAFTLSPGRRIHHWLFG